jgi:hypothetical protein
MEDERQTRACLLTGDERGDEKTETRNKDNGREQRDWIGLE